MDTLQKLLSDFAAPAGRTVRQVLPTGIMSVDWALGGGMPRGMITMLHGPEGAGKSGMMVDPMKNVVANPMTTGKILYIATENKVNTDLFFDQGVPETALTVVRTVDPDKPLTGGKVFDLLRVAVKEYELIVLDSIAALVPRVANESDSDSSGYALVGRLLSQQLPIVSNILGATKNVVVLINQERANIAAPGTKSYIDWRIFGGFTIKYTPAVIMRMRRSGVIQVGNDVVGFNASLTVSKHSVGPERRKAAWKVMYATGVDRVDASFETAKMLGLITRAAKLVVGETQVDLCHPGKRSFNDAVDRLREEPELLTLLNSTIMTANGNTSEVDDEPDPA